MTELENIVAWQGMVELTNASWTLDSGSTVDFRIIETPGNEQPHPFKAFQRRRSGRMGQRFHLVCVEDGSTVPIYDSEAMFCQWSESDRGQAIKLWLDEHEHTIHPYCGFKKRTAKEAGSVFAAVFVLITDDGHAVDQEAEDRLQGKKRKLSSDAHVMITGELFLQYLTERCEYTKKLERQHQVWTPDLAKRYVKHVLGIESLSDLDRDETAAKKFHELFRTPFAIRQGRE